MTLPLYYYMFYCHHHPFFRLHGTIVICDNPIVLSILLKNIFISSFTCRPGLHGVGLVCWGRCCSFSWSCWQSTQAWRASQITGITRPMCWQATYRELLLLTGWSVYLACLFLCIKACPHVRLCLTLKLGMRLCFSQAFHISSMFKTSSSDLSLTETPESPLSPHHTLC